MEISQEMPNVTFEYEYDVKEQRWNCYLNIFKDDGTHKVSYTYLGNYPKQEDYLSALQGLIKVLDRELNGN